MGSVVVYAIITLWIIAMVPAVLAPFFMDRPKHGVSVSPKPTAIPLRPQASHPMPAESPADRSAA